MYHLSLAAISLAKRTHTLHGVLRSLSTLSTYYLFINNHQATEDALKVLNQAIFVLENYNINNFVKSEVLAMYMLALEK